MVRRLDHLLIAARSARRIQPCRVFASGLLPEAFLFWLPVLHLLETCEPAAAQIQPRYEDYGRVS